MKITPAQMFSSSAIGKSYSSRTKKNVFDSSNQTPQKSSVSLVDKNYNRLLVKPASVSFGKNPMPPLAKVPLEQRLGTASSFLLPNDLLLVGKDINQAQKDLLEAVPLQQNLISHVLFVEDKDVKGSFALGLRNGAIPYIQNLSEEPMYATVENRNFVLKKGGAMYVYENSNFKSGKDGETFSITQNPNASMSDLEKYGVEIFDFSQMDKKMIDQLNEKHIQTIAVDPEKKKDAKKITFADVGGQDEAIKQLKKSVIYPIKHPNAFNVINHGVILEGGPGTGKTLLAEALANETDAHFIKLNGLEMESKWVGESEENWRNLFKEAKDNQPSIIFIDEIDAVAKKREGGATSRHDDKVVNQLLTLMSDLEKSGDNVFVIAATNKSELLDDAITRSGRFGNPISVPNPDLAGCEMIFDIHAKDKKISENFDKKSFVKELHDADVNGADIAAVVESAQSNAYERNGIFEKMENGTFEDSDVENMILEPEDFDNALSYLKEHMIGKEKKKQPIGFRMPSADNS